MTIRELKNGDAETFIAWYSARIGMRLPADWVPGTGLAVCDDAGRVLAIALLYLEKSSPVAVFGWGVTDPALSPLVAGRAVKAVLRAMPEYAREKGAVHLIGMFGSSGINRELDRMGFVNGDPMVQEKYIRL